MLRRNVNTALPRHQATLRPGVFVSAARCIYNYNFGQVPLGVKFQSSSKQPSTAAAPADASAAAASSSPLSATPIGKVQMTQLHNGAHVITHQLGGALAAVGAYIRAGSIYDPPNCPGVAAMMHLALTTSNYNNSLFQLDRNIRSVGAAQEHFELYKHYIGIRVDVRADKWRSSVTPSRVKAGAAVNHQQQQQPLNLSIMQDNIFSCLAAPRFHETDIERFRDTVDNEVKELKWQNPGVYATHMLETVAFYREPLGNPRFVPEINNGNITSKVLLEHYSRYIVPSNVVIAGVNVDHDALIAEYENTPYPHSATSPHHMHTAAAHGAACTRGALHPAAPSSEMKQYTGGERLDQEDRAKDMGTRPDMDVDTICSLGWLSFGRDVTMLRDYAACLVFQQLMDMQLGSSVAYTRCGGDYSLPGVRTFYSPFQTAGLQGFTVICPPAQMVQLLVDTATTMRQLAPSTSANTLAVARHRARLNFLNSHADNVRDYCDYLGTSLLQMNNAARVLDLEDVTHAIDTVEGKDIARVSDAMFSHPASLYGHGEVLGIPSLRQMGLK